jgi:hypothetical protein
MYFAGIHAHLSYVQVAVLDRFGSPPAAGIITFSGALHNRPPIPPAGSAGQGTGVCWVACSLALAWRCRDGGGLTSAA